MKSEKWDGKIVKSKMGTPTAPELPEIDEELASLLRTALAGTNSKRKNAAKNIPIELIITLRKKRLPIRAIARICKCNPSNIRTRLQGKMEDIDMMGEYKKNRADVLAFTQRRILTGITDKDIEEADLRDKSTSYGILYDKERLELGKSLGGEAKFVVNVVNYGTLTPLPVDVTPKEING